MPLSEPAMQFLRQTGMQRDPRKTCSEEQIRSRLHELGLPEYETAIAFEREFGGLIWDGKLWGTYAALVERVPEDVWCMTLGRTQAQYHGQPLLPIGVLVHTDCSKHFVKYWMSPAGWMLLDIGDEILPEAESATCFFEREPLRRGLVHKRPRAILQWRAIPTGTVEDFAVFGEDDSAPDDDSCVDVEPRYLRDPQRVLDQDLAEALNLPLYRPASDSCMHIWYDGKCLLFPYESWGGANRVLRGDTTEDVVRMVLAAVNVRPTVGVRWEGPLGEAPRPGDDVIAKVASVERAEWRGHLLVIGRPGHYRVHEQLFDKPLYVARLWEARREEWEAMQKRRLTR